MSSNQHELIDFDTADPMELLEQVGDDRLPRAQWPQALADLVDVVVAVLARRGHDSDQAKSDAQAVAFALADYLGGRQLYLPRGDSLRRAMRDISIWDDFNGKNVLDLARRHDLTDRQVYTILSEQKALHRRRLQGALFETGGTP